MKENTEKNKSKKIIFIVILSILAVICILSIIIISSKYNLRESASIGIIGGADGPTAIYISEKQNWKNIVVYSLIAIVLDIIIFTIIKKIESKRQKSLLKLSILIIVIFNILVSILLFSSAVILLLLINIVIITVSIIKLIYDRKKNDN